MAQRHSDRVEMNLEAGPETDDRQIQEGEPFRIAILGDFSGRSEKAPIPSRRTLMVDRDNFEAMMTKLDVGIELPAGRIAIRDLDDFHPDRIYATYPVFRQLRDTRKRLEDPETFKEAARELMGESLAPVPARSGQNLLDEILGISGGAAARSARKVDELQQIIDRAIRPHLVPRQDPRAPEIIRQVDEAGGDLMRAVLHHPKFQAIEAAWRSLFMLIRRLDTGPDLKVYILDVSKQDLLDDPDAVYERLTERGEPWAVIAGNYAFGTEDIPLLSVLGTIANNLHAPFLGEADLSLIGAGAAWTKFRKLPEAAHVSLALPRVLLRLPYGQDTAPCETFGFEEVAGKPGPNQMLFGNPALLCAMLLGESFMDSGWSLRPDSVREISGLPVYVYKDDDESVQLPCAELELKQETAEALIESGFIPMASIRNQDVVRALMFQNVADPPGALRGRWA